MAKRYGASLGKEYKHGVKDEPILQIAQVIPVPTPAPVVVPKPVEPVKVEEKKVEEKK